MLTNQPKLSFRAPTVHDMAWIRELTGRSQPLACDYTFGNIFIWSHIYHTKTARYGNLFLSQNCVNGEYSYCFPVGEGSVGEAIEALKAHCRETGEDSGGKLRLFALTGSDSEKLRSLYGDKVEIFQNRNSFDYIYLAENLASLPGKKYHQKRNHISFFTSNYSYLIEKITRDNMAECFEMNSAWEEENREKDPVGIDHELNAIKLAFGNYDEIGFRGIILRVEGRVIAYTLGEALSDTVFCTHIEKAFGDIRGAYPMINREFAKLLRDDGFIYINREEDDGIEGLRRAKLSYYPDILLEKDNALFEL